jgi:O-antigen/teichoic acid export membrane protein
MKKILGNLLKLEFVFNVTTLMAGSVVSQIIPVLVAPIISRLYYPEDYAVVAAYNSITVLLTIVSTGMLSSALMIDKTDNEAVNTAAAAFLVTTGITAISLAIFLIFNESITQLTGNENITFWLYLIPLTVFFTGGYQTLSMWNNRLNRYKRLAFNKILQTIVTSSATLVLGFLSYRSTGLMISLLLGQIFAFGVLFFQTYRNDNELLKKINYVQIKSSFMRHKDFPKYNMPQGFLDGLRESSIVLVISNYFGPVVLGSYSFAMGMLNKPLHIVGEAYRQVFFQKASKLFNAKKNIWSFTKKNILVLSSIVLPFFLLLFIWGADIFALTFGENWREAGIIAQILSIWMFSRFLVSPLSSIPLVFNEQKVFFYYGFFNNITLPATLLLAAFYMFSLEVGFTLFSIVGILNLSIQFLWFKQIIKKHALTLSISED